MLSEINLLLKSSIYKSTKSAGMELEPGVHIFNPSGSLLFLIKRGVMENMLISEKGRNSCDWL